METQNVQRPTDLHAPGALEQLFAYNRAKFGGWRMELEGGDETPPPTEDEQNETEEQTTVEASPEASADEWKPPASQAELNRLINTAREKERKKFADYETYKSQSEQFESVNKTLGTLKDALISQALDVAAAGTTLKAAHLRNNLDLTKVVVGDDGTVSGLNDLVSTFLNENPEYVRQDEPDNKNGVGDRDAGRKTPPSLDIDAQIEELTRNGDLKGARLLKLRKVQKPV